MAEHEWALDDITQKDLVREGLGNSFTIRSTAQPTDFLAFYSTSRE